jgi:hypothetical protein
MMMQPNGAGRGLDLGSLSRKGLAWSSEQLAALLTGRAEVEAVEAFERRNPPPTFVGNASTSWFSRAAESSARRSGCDP